MLTACGGHILPKSRLGILNVFSHTMLLKVAKFFSVVCIIYQVNDRLNKHYFLRSIGFGFLIVDQQLGF